MNVLIEIITIGNELLEGQIQNTNVTYVCKKLYKAGYLPFFQCSILDQEKALIDQFNQSLSRSDVVICSGGLGPTQDDITLKVAASLFDSEFHIHKDLLKNLEKRYGKIADKKIILPFANVPKKAELMLDQLGMAPGFIFTQDQKKLILLPGVPYEFRHLVDHNLIPYLKKHFPIQIKEYKKVIHLCRVAESHITPFLDLLLKKDPKLRVGIYPHLGILSLHFKVSASSQIEANKSLNSCLAAVKKEFPQHWFDGKFQNIEEAIHDLLKKKKLSLSIAESCTGGALSALLTGLGGASEFLKGSIVSYDNEAKQKILKVKKETLQKKGAVSEECVIEMAKGVQKLFKTDLAFATSGIAGPTGGTAQKPVGYVWMAIAYKNKILIRQNMQLSGDRQTIIQRTVNYTLAELWINKDNL